MNKNYCPKNMDLFDFVLSNIIVPDIIKTNCANNCGRETKRDTRQENIKNNLKENKKESNCYPCNSSLNPFNISNEIKRVIYNEPATIILWKDGTKTKAMCHEEDTYDRATGLIVCVVKKFFKSSKNFNNFIKNWTDEDGSHPVYSYKKNNRTK